MRNQDKNLEDEINADIEQREINEVEQDSSS